MINYWLELLVVCIGACCVQWLIYALAVFLLGSRITAETVDPPDGESSLETRPANGQVDIQITQAIAVEGVVMFTDARQ